MCAKFSITLVRNWAHRVEEEIELSGMAPSLVIKTGQRPPFHAEDRNCCYTCSTVVQPRCLGCQEARVHHFKPLWAWLIGACGWSAAGDGRKGGCRSKEERKKDRAQGERREGKEREKEGEVKWPAWSVPILGFSAFKNSNFHPKLPKFSLLAPFLNFKVSKISLLPIKIIGFHIYELVSETYPIMDIDEIITTLIF